ncbi:hypothetical protein AK812_SmicGene24937 [Symbiodinium microadriaticum]|uniref:Uncharacterized protein n=1 Tax=Symbiodinium microadriaticum TaxID=2951 RepID=A0A1Q9DDB6_SYMMI|nr:hypothetical protein AK812_SmicGene24937 [Symbiodinium microadriaticum]
MKDTWPYNCECPAQRLVRFSSFRHRDPRRLSAAIRIATASQQVSQSADAACNELRASKALVFDAVHWPPCGQGSCGSDYGLEGIGIGRGQFVSELKAAIQSCRPFDEGDCCPTEAQVDGGREGVPVHSLHLLRAHLAHYKDDARCRAGAMIMQQDAGDFR